jgi:hypothetical protein
LTRQRGFAGACCHACGRRPSTVVVRAVRREPGGRGTVGVDVGRWYYCAAHAAAALHHQAELVARAVDGRTSQVRPPLALRFPFPLPRALFEAVGGALPDPVVALYWHGPADVLALYGEGLAFLGPPATHSWWELVGTPPVAGWLRERLVDLGRPGGCASHHLVLDRTRGTAQLVRAARARWLVTRRAAGSRRPSF